MAKKSINVNGVDFEEMISEQEIKSKIQEVASFISADYELKDVVMIGVLNGAFMFFSDLTKAMTIDTAVSFVKVASYQGVETTGKVRELIGFSGALRNKHVLVVDDVLDSGFTYQFLMETLKAKQPASIKFVCLLHKPDAQKVEANPDYTCFKIANDFVVGYGLDYNQSGRTYTSIYKKK
ncbi:MAG: hypoxanthine phosphoribosyltransferase [Bacteroidia bacterium]